jgi:hypothetical protein
MNIYIWIEISAVKENIVCNKEKEQGHLELLGKASQRH